MNPEQIKQEQERVGKLLEGISADEEWVFFATGTFAGEIRRASGDSFGHLFNEVEGDDLLGNLAAQAPSLARQYAALLAAHAEALEREARMAAECDMYRVTLQNLHQAAANMLTGIEVNNRLHPNAPARRKDIAGPVVTSLRAAVLSARVALSPNPPTGYAPPPTQAPASAGGAE